MTGEDERIGQPTSGDTSRPNAAAGPSAKQTAETAKALKGGDLQAYIGRQLRAVYDDVARQPVPDRFLELMKKLEAAGH